MRKNYIQPVVKAQFLQGMHVICNSPAGELTGGTEGGDPNVLPVY